MSFSIVVPTCNRPEMLRECLVRLPRSSEIIVTDDSRGNATRDIISQEFPHMHWTRAPGLGPAANRNHGARQASGDWIAFVDDDCEPGAGWLAGLENAARGGAEVIEGKTECPGRRDTPFQEHVENLTGGTLISCNFAMRRDAFFKSGGFDEDFREAYYEDTELAWRIRKCGLRVVFAPEAVVIHQPGPVTLDHIAKRQLQLRWTMLYRLKTKSRTPLWLEYSLNLLRTTLTLPRRMNSACWRTPLVHQALALALFPMVLPYLYFWQWRYREMLNRRALENREQPYQRLSDFRPLLSTGQAVLMYHKLDIPRLRSLRKGLFVPAHLFEKQLRELTEAGWRSVSLADYLERGPQPKSVVITFDDGFESVWRNGMKPMAKHGFRAIQFLVPGSIGKFNHWDFAETRSGEKLMDDAQIRDWLAAGHEIGAHTMTHPFLTRLPLDEARTEIRDSKHALEDRFGVAVRHFAYPYGDWNPAVRDLVREAGFASAAITQYGVNRANHDPWTLRRVASFFPLSERGNLFKVFLVR